MQLQHIRLGMRGEEVREMRVAVGFYRRTAANPTRPAVRSGGRPIKNVCRAWPTAAAGRPPARPTARQLADRPPIGGEKTPYFFIIPKKKIIIFKKLFKLFKIK
jgi:hypothetical protein